MVQKIEKVINEEVLEDANNMRSGLKGHLLCFCSGVN